MKKVVILKTQSGDWEGLFLNGKLISESHHLGGSDRLWLLRKSEQLGFTSNDIVECELNDVDEETLCYDGNLPDHISKLNGTYE